jgi:hypothetical protein
MELETADIPKLKIYATGDRQFVQAQQIWEILVAFVSSPIRDSNTPKKITYGDLAKCMESKNRRVAPVSLGPSLGIIARYCIMNKLPALNIVAVNKSTNQPGVSVVYYSGDLVREQKEVYKINWLHFKTPSSGTLRKVQEWSRKNGYVD